MAKQFAARVAQYALTVAHEIDFTGTMEATDGVTKALATNGNSFVIANLPIGAIIQSCYTIGTVADAAVAVAVKVGATTIANANLTTAVVKAGEAAATGLVNADGKNVVMEVTGDGALTGKLIFVLTYVVLGRTNEVQTH